MTDIFLVLLSATLQAVSYTLCFVLTFRQNKTGKKTDANRYNSGYGQGAVFALANA